MPRLCWMIDSWTIKHCENHVHVFFLVCLIKQSENITKALKTSHSDFHDLCALWLLLRTTHKMIAPVIFLFQILVSGTMFSNHLTIRLASRNIRLRQVYYALLRIVSKWTLHKVRSNYRLPRSFVQSHDRLLMLGDNRNQSQSTMAHLIPDATQLMVHEEEVPNQDLESWSRHFTSANGGADDPLLHMRSNTSTTKTRTIVNRKHRLDQYKLYYPGYMRK